MNKVLSVVALFAIVAGAAQAVAPPEDNGIGVLCVFTTPDPPFENQANVIAGQTVDLYFVLYHPIAPSGFIGSADFGWVIEPAVPYFVLESGGPVGSLNIGSPQNPILGFGLTAPVLDGHALLFRARLLFTAAPGMTSLFLRPHATLPSVPGQMSYVDYGDPSQLQPMRPYSQDDSFANPVFGVNTAPVATAPMTWGAVKALFD